MTIKEKITDNIAVLTISGDLVSEVDTGKLKDKIHSLVGDNMKRVVIDLGGIDYINSSGLGTLISTLTTMRSASGDLRLARLGERVENLFVITKLVKVFDTYETVDRAIASYSSKNS
jgi:anti-sigma B factor antagonist